MNIISKMSLKETLDKIDLLIRATDITYFCDNIDVIEEFINRYGSKSNDQLDVKQFLIDNEEHIDKEKLLLLVAKNCQDSLKEINKRIEILKKFSSKEKSSNLINELKTLYLHSQNQRKILSKILKIGRGMEKIITFYGYDEKEQRNRIEIVDSREIIDGIKISSSKKLKKFDEIDLCCKEKDENEKYGIEYILQSIFLTDLYNIFPDEELADDIRTMILENKILQSKLKTKDELRNMKNQEDYQEYEKLIDNLDFKDLLTDIKETLREYVSYLDINKLLLISGYRFKNGLESGKIDTELLIYIKELLEIILSQLEPNSKISCELQMRQNDGYTFKDIHFSTKDLEKCINQITETGYISDKKIEEYKEKLINQEINLFQIDEENIDIILSENELEKLSLLNEENLIYVIKKCNWDNRKIVDSIKKMNECSSNLLKTLIENNKIETTELINLYEQGKISIQNLQDLKEKIKLDKYISFNKLNTYYKQHKVHPENEEFAKKYNKYLDLYKNIFIEGKTKEEVEEISNQLMEQIIESYDNSEEYDNAIQEYYKEKLLTLSSIVDWNDEKTISNLYQNEIIGLKELEGLFKQRKLSFNYITNEYIRLINDSNINYNTRLEYIKSGYVSEESIIDLFKKNLLFEEDLKQLSEEGFVKEKKYKNAITNREKEELEKNSTIKLIGLNKLSKKNNDIYGKGGTKNSESSKIIIDPNEREEYISLLKGYKAITDVEEDSPFYNYEFYVIPDEGGQIGLNSVVIAERYYEEKLNEARFAINNATYFFKYKDLMVLSNLNKSEMTQERKNIVFTAKHGMATEKKVGSWASSVLYGIAKTLLSSDLNEYSKQHQRLIVIETLSRIYDDDELSKILQKGINIDTGEYNCDIEEPEKLAKKRCYKNPKNNKEER